MISLVIALQVSAQDKDVPQDYTKIKFTYIQKPRFGITEEMIYGNEEMMQNTVLKDRLKIQEVDGYRYGYVPIGLITEKEKKIIIGLFSHQTYLITGVYDSKAKATMLIYSRPDDKQDATRQLLKKLFGETYGKNVNKSVSFDFETGRKHLESGMVAEESKFDISQNFLRFETGDADHGLYEEKENSMVLTNAAYPDEKLERYVSPIVPFANTGGISKIESTNYVIELVSIAYE